MSALATKDNQFQSLAQWLSLRQRPLFYTVAATSAGRSLCITTETHLVALSPLDRGQSDTCILARIGARLQPTSLTEKSYFTPNMPLLLIGTPFQLAVWRALLNVPFGSTTSYQALAHAADVPHAVRAVANAVGANPITYFVPCHRILRSDGSIGGYYWGLGMKKELLAQERA